MKPIASWPLAAGRWPLAAGRWPLAAGRWPLAAGLWLMLLGALGLPTAHAQPFAASAQCQPSDDCYNPPPLWQPLRMLPGMPDPPIYRSAQAVCSLFEGNESLNPGRLSQCAPLYQATSPTSGYQGCRCHFQPTPEYQQSSWTPPHFAVYGYLYGPYYDCPYPESRHHDGHAPPFYVEINPTCKRPGSVEDGTCEGNPVLVGSGQKLHRQLVYQGAGAHPLRFEFTYRSPVQHWTYWHAYELKPWRHNYDRRVSDRDRGVVHLYRPDGNVYSLRSALPVYNVNPSNPLESLVPMPAPGSGQPVVWADPYHPQRGSLMQMRDALDRTTGWLYRSFDDDSVETYDAQGRLLSVAERNGWTTTLTYDAQGRLITLTNAFGRQLRLAYDAQGRLAQVIPPGAQQDGALNTPYSPIRLAWAEAASRANGTAADSRQLSSLTWQDGTVLRLHYDDPKLPLHLSGITDEAGVRIASYWYHPDGRAAGEVKAGGVDRMEFTYGGTALAPTARVLDFSGNPQQPKVRDYAFTTVGRYRLPVSVAGSGVGQGGAVNTGYSYDVQGRPTKLIAADGSVTFITTNAKGQITEEATFPAAYAQRATRPSLNLATQVISTRWHASFNLPTAIAEPNRITTYGYDARGNLTSEKVQPTTDAVGRERFGASADAQQNRLARTWAYTGSNLERLAIQFIDDVEIARFEFQYTAEGDPLRLRDGLSGGQWVAVDVAQMELELARAESAVNPSPSAVAINRPGPKAGVPGNSTATSKPMPMAVSAYAALMATLSNAYTACMRVKRCRDKVQEAVKTCKNVECKFERHAAHHYFEIPERIREPRNIKISEWYCEHYQLLCFDRSKKGKNPDTGRNNGEIIELHFPLYCRCSENMHSKFLPPLYQSPWCR
jgi:YD repeat-containing protein